MDWQSSPKTVEVAMGENDQSPGPDLWELRINSRMFIRSLGPFVILVNLHFLLPFDATQRQDDGLTKRMGF